MTKMISLDSEPYPQRFEFNKPFDFVSFHNISTSNYLGKLSEITDPMLLWFDYDSKLIKIRETDRKHNVYSIEKSHFIFEDIRIISKTCKDNDIFIITVSIDTPKNIFVNPNIRKQFTNELDSRLTGRYKSDNIENFRNYQFVIQNILLNTFAIDGSFMPAKFIKLFSFYYNDTTPMYTLGGIFTSHRTNLPNFNNEFLNLGEDNITDIDVPLLTYREKLRLDRKINHFKKQSGATIPQEEILKQLEFEFDCTDLLSYIKFYRYYPQYYEGIV